MSYAKTTATRKIDGYDEFMSRVHAILPVHEGNVPYAEYLESTVRRPLVGEMIWDVPKGFRRNPLPVRIGKLRNDGYVTIHIVGNKEEYKDYKWLIIKSWRTLKRLLHVR